MATDVETIKTNLNYVESVISKNARKAGRSAKSVRLVVVTKLQPLTVVRQAIAAGAQLLGENYPEEGVAKKQALQNETVSWHMIGHVQSRKAALVAQNFDLVHSVDSLRLAERLNGACEKIGKKLPVLLQINIDAELTKGGWCVASGCELDEWYADLEAIMRLDHLELRGLMCMPPLVEDPELSRPHFARLRNLRDEIERRLGLPLPELSMGTSADYAVAVEEGATFVRIGSTILGPRPPKG